MAYSQSYIAQKQYGANVRRMVQALAREPQSEARDAAAENVAKYMRQKSFEYNREFPSNEVVMADIRQMSNGAIALNTDTLDHTRLDTSTVKSGRRNSGRNASSSNSAAGTASAGANAGHAQRQRHVNKRTSTK